VSGFSVGRWIGSESSDHWSATNGLEVVGIRLVVFAVVWCCGEDGGCWRMSSRLMSVEREKEEESEVGEGEVK
jgi:hypothetical protein